MMWRFTKVSNEELVCRVWFRIEEPRFAGADHQDGYFVGRCRLSRQPRNADRDDKPAKVRVS